MGAKRPIRKKERVLQAASRRIPGRDEETYHQLLDLVRAVSHSFSEVRSRDVLVHESILEQEITRHLDDPWCRLRST